MILFFFTATVAGLGLCSKQQSTNTSVPHE